MPDPTTTTDLIVKELTEITIQYLGERDLLETSEAITANFVRGRELLRELLKAGWPHSRLVQAAMRAPPPARKPGRPPQRRDRHLQIAGAVALLVGAAGLNPTRSHSERRLRTPSACSIVTAALKWWGEHLDERTVEGIWNRYRKSPRIIHRSSENYIRTRYRIPSLIIR